MAFVGLSCLFFQMRQASGSTVGSGSSPFIRPAGFDVGECSVTFRTRCIFTRFARRSSSEPNASRDSRCDSIRDSQERSRGASDAERARAPCATSTHPARQQAARTALETHKIAVHNVLFPNGLAREVEVKYVILWITCHITLDRGVNRAFSLLSAPTRRQTGREACPVFARRAGGFKNLP